MVLNGAECQNRRKMNRYEQIKQMSMEEMAALIDRIREDQRRCVCLKRKPVDSMEWLGRDVERKGSK